MALLDPPPVIAEDSGGGGLQIMISAGPVRFVADEPVELGGLDVGPTPHELVSAGLAACTSQTLRLYAKRKGWALGKVVVTVSHRHDPAQVPPDGFERRISLGGVLDDAQRAHLMEIAEKCPVHRMLAGGARIDTAMIPAA